MNLGSAGSLFWPILGLSLLQYLASSAVQTVTGVLNYVLLRAFAILGETSEVALFVSILIVNLLTFAILGLGYGYISLAVPACAVEGLRAPAGSANRPSRPP